MYACECACVYVYLCVLFCSSPMYSLCFIQLCLCVLCMDDTLYAHYLYAYSSIQILTHFCSVHVCVSVCVHSFLKSQWSQLWIFSISVRVCVCVYISCTAHFGIVFFISLVVGFLFAAWHTLLAHFLRRELFLRRYLNNNLCTNVCTL